ncbi:hypothetical protein FRC04_009323 [Tulasnella sp. 424]|nr:hypothetical protein FRC04_009323 [Tulasnella sp. 424]
MHGGSSGGDSVVKHVMNPLKGFLAVSSACVTSGLVGVYFEMVLNESQSDLLGPQHPTFHILLPPGTRPRILLRKLDIKIVRRKAVKAVRGLRWVARATVFGGLVTAVVIKYTDNIMKGFATSLSMINSFLASVALFDFSIAVPFVVGSSIVLAATWF